MISRDGSWLSGAISLGVPRIGLALLPVLATALWSAPATAIGVGIEGGATYTQTIHMGSPNSAWTANGGVILDTLFPLSAVFLDLWADVQTPIELQTSASASYAVPSYVPIDLGLRVGLSLGLLRPYAGILGQAAILIDGGGYPNFVNPVLGLGADLGLDFAITILRLGVELRAVGTVSSVWQGPTGSALEIEPLASVGLSL